MVAVTKFLLPQEEYPTIPDNYLVAQSCLSSLLARLKCKPDILQQYDDVIKDQLNQKPKIRRNTVDAIDYLRERSESEREYKKEELEVQKREIEVQAEKQDQAQKQQQAMFSALMAQIQQQQQNVQAMLAAQQQQRTKLLMEFMENNKKH